MIGIKYQPGKDKADPLNVLSWHRMPETEADETEYTVKAITEAERPIVIDKIKAKTRKDGKLLKPRNVIARGSWEDHRRDPDITYNNSVREELCVAEDLIFRLNKIILPDKLQKLENHCNHTRIRTSRIYRDQADAKFGFLCMSSMIDRTVGQYHNCKVPTR